jgi:hypothetical protein
MAAYEDLFYASESLVGECYKYCPIECSRVKYELVLLFNSYPTLWYSKVLTNNTKFNNLINAYFEDVNILFINYTDNFAELKNSIARINVYYEDLAYVKVDDNPNIKYEFGYFVRHAGRKLWFVSRYDLWTFASFFFASFRLDVYFYLHNILGASVLSFTEIFKLFYELVKESLQRERENTWINQKVKSMMVNTERKSKTMSILF